MKSAIRKMGNSHGVIIPKPLLEEFGAKANDQVEIRIKKGKLLITATKRHPREGWAEDAKALAAAGEGGLVWPEFANDGDKDLKW